MKNVILYVVAALLAAPAVLAQSKTQERKPSQKTSSQDESLHKFFEYLDFEGQAYDDKKNSECEPGFIGWYQESSDEDPILIIPNDAFRHIQVECSAAELKQDNVSCLSKNTIKRRLLIRGTVYTTTLTKLRKEGQTSFRLQRHQGSKLQKSCLYTPMLNR